MYPPFGLVTFGTFMNFLFCALVFYIATSTEVLWIRPWLGKGGGQLMTAVALALFAIFCLGSYSRERRVWVFRSYLSWPAEPNLVALGNLVGVTIVYLAVHEVVLGDKFISVKYITFFIFLLLITQKSIPLRSCAKVFAVCCLLTSIFFILQAVLIAVVWDMDLSGFSRINLGALGRRDAEYVNVFGGLIRLGYFPEYGPLKFYRGIGLTTEPKFATQVLWVGIACYYFTLKANQRPSLWILCTYFLGLFISHSFSSLGVIYVFFLTLCFGRLRVSSVWLLLTLFLSAFSYLYLLELAPQFAGFAGDRFRSFYTSNRDLYSLFASNHSLLGRSFGWEEGTSIRVPGVFWTLLRYGWIGLILRIGILVVALNMGFERLRRTSNRNLHTAVRLLMGVLVVFGQISPELTTPLFCFCIALIYKDPEILDSLESTKNSARVEGSPLVAYTS